MRKSTTHDIDIGSIGIGNNINAPNDGSGIPVAFGDAAAATTGAGVSFSGGFDFSPRKQFLGEKQTFLSVFQFRVYRWLIFNQPVIY